MANENAPIYMLSTNTYTHFPVFSFFLSFFLVSFLSESVRASRHMSLVVSC